MVAPDRQVDGLDACKGADPLGKGRAHGDDGALHADGRPKIGETVRVIVWPGVHVTAVEREYEREAGPPREPPGGESLDHGMTVDQPGARPVPSRAPGGPRDHAIRKRPAGLTGDIQVAGPGHDTPSSFATRGA